MFKIIAVIIHIINILTIMYMVFKEKRSANSIIAWTLILYIAPIIGFVAFLLVGRRINKSNMFCINDANLKVFEEYSQHLEDNILLNTKGNNIKNIDMIKALETLEYSPYRENNKVQLFSDGNEFFHELLESLRSAKRSINIEFYIFKNDEIGSQILSILEEKARAGVQVRLLYDSVGSRSLNKKLLKNLVDAGGKTGEFFPFWLKFININMNFRNHRKIVVIDNEVGFVGGFNVGDEYLGKDKKFGYWRDTHIKFEGSAVVDLNLRFLGDWQYATREDNDLKAALKSNNQLTKQGNAGMQILSSGPNLGDKYEIKLAYKKMIEKAREYIYIQSPYLIIDASISDSLKLAAASGVDVRIMIPGKGDHPFVYWANLVYAGDLLEYGVKIYHYDKSAFLHAKTVVVDDEVCSVGTANMDTRSFELNFEVNAFMYSEEIAKKQKLEFEADIKKCEELTLNDYRSRSTGVKVKEALSKLFSAVL